MKDRIRQIMEAKHMTQQVFAQFIDMSPASLSSIFNGRTKPTLNIVEAIKKKIPEINIDWLLFGSGEMYGGVPASHPTEDGGHAVLGIEPTLDFEDDAPSAASAHPASPSRHTLVSRVSPASFSCSMENGPCLLLSLIM